MAKAQRKKAHARAEAARARELTDRYREDKASKVVTFDDVAKLLDGPYSVMKAKAKIDAFDLPTVEIQGALSVRPKDVDQEVPVIKAIPQAPVIIAAIENIKIKQDIDLLAYWPDYGYANFDQLDTMASLLEARSRFSLVARTTEWIDGVEWCIAHLREPFADTSNVTKVLCSQLYTKFTPKLTESVVFAERAQVDVEALNLSVNKIPGEVVSGYQLLDFRENLWLHTASIQVSMLVLRDEYRGVGIINPSYQDFKLPDQRLRTADGFRASEPKNERIICIFHIDRHWVTFLVDRNIHPKTMKTTCYMFDPMQSSHNYNIIEKSVRATIEDLLQLQDQVIYEKVKWCNQQDGSSCGVWCIAVVEMLLAKKPWGKCIYDLLPYLRMRFLHKALIFVESKI
ncbi:hypothetical protein F441_09645 [Phytophthora nicotianae CJ01A1]|uniref:Ubiquitin-like protease family profile domain-containing protein n=1 Tax=Phytophthora nicotianae CJ01A1 TaxID=1317063 RepID=W2WYL4_PHYNI|nr:hypothetical protein F441_09645 [Phytophthora nicotianae CJ01A1]